ncbi:Hypothetical protein, putative [Bodo saltans]|uniref:Uncharacterized protein n=1 Tax=Bodo saltans TaxID=75058 RepID=A0A0S4IVQ0_BODSA|nr:Hypothetical protein, putative [Bodo saltans]|eukprot:CUG04413.1 Hypothetical protein, putative [Bodo saltans]
MDAPPPPPLPPLRLEDFGGLLHDWPPFDDNRLEVYNRPWDTEDGYHRFVNFSKKGPSNQCMSAHLAVRYGNNPTKWVPFIFDANAPATTIADEHLERLGVDMAAYKRDKHVTVRCGDLHLYVRKLEGGGTTVAGQSMAGVNVIGVDVLNMHLAALWNSLAKTLGSPTVPQLVAVPQVVVWVQYGGKRFKVALGKISDVDDLAQTVQKEVQSPQMLYVKDQDGNRLEPDAALVANTEETPYVLERKVFDHETLKLKKK